MRAFRIREALPLGVRVALGTALVALVLGAWFVVTAGATAEARIISPVILPSPKEVLLSAPVLWFDRALTRSVIYSLLRVLAGFGSAVVLAVPLGILMGAFTPVRAFFQPLAVVGGYLPIAALVPLTISWFGVDEGQKIFFLGMATFVFLLPLVISAVDDVDGIYLKTAYTLGAAPLVAVWKVLVPVAMPAIWDAMRLAFGIGWTYIILAEIVAAERGLGNLIIVSQRRGPREHIYLVLVVIIVLAFLTDKLLEWAGRALFPHREVGR